MTVPLRNPFFFKFDNFRTSNVFYKKAVLKNFAIFPVKNLCWSLFLRPPTLKNICERLLLQVIFPAFQFFGSAFQFLVVVFFIYTEAATAGVL